MNKQIAQKEQPSLVADAIRFVVGMVFVVMSLAFVTVPYALSSVPGTAGQQVAAASAKHLS